MLLLLFSCSVVSDSLQPHRLQHARLPCPSLSPGIYSNSFPLSRWCLQTPHPLLPLLPLQSIFLIIRVFSNEVALHIRWPKHWSFSLSISPSMNIQSWFPLGLTGLISLQSKELSKVFSNTTIWKHKFFSTQPFIWLNIHPRIWLLEKPQLWLYAPSLAKWSLLFNTLFRFVIAFLPKSKRLLISCLRSPSAVFLSPRKEICHCFYSFPMYLQLSD